MHETKDQYHNRPSALHSKFDTTGSGNETPFPKIIKVVDDSGEDHDKTQPTIDDTTKKNYIFVKEGTDNEDV